MKPHNFSNYILISVACMIMLVLQGCLTLTDSHHASRWRHAIPERTSSSMPGEAFANSIRNANETDREEAILAEIRRGNIPDFLRKFKAIKVQQTIAGFGKVSAVFWTMPDYLAIGNERDYVRMPMNPITAQNIADHFGCVLPTPKMVDHIYQQATIKVAPQPMPYGPEMVSIPQIMLHNQKINEQLAGRSTDDLIAGHKKDVVITKQLQRRKERVAIYGWHRLNGKAIQPLSLVHGNYYADYSHGIRLVANMMMINEQLYPVSEVMKHPQLSAIISEEGKLPYARYPTEGALKKTRWFPKGWNKSS